MGQMERWLAEREREREREVKIEPMTTKVRGLGC